MSDLGFFSLNRDGDSANVRILSTSVDNIERKSTHTVNVGGKNKKFHCLGEGCHFCSHNNNPYERLVVHLYDYTDNTEKVWNRTPNKKFLDALRNIENSWGDLSKCVLKITRHGNDFPSYDVSVLNPQLFGEFDFSNVNTSVAFRIASYRSNDEIDEYYRTGNMPEHVKKNSNFVPKEQYFERMKNNATNTMPTAQSTTTSPAENLQSPPNPSDFEKRYEPIPEEFDLPF